MQQARDAFKSAFPLPHSSQAVPALVTQMLGGQKVISLHACLYWATAATDGHQDLCPSASQVASSAR